MYSVLSWTKNFSVKGMSDITSYTIMPIEQLVHSKMKTENQCSFGSGVTKHHRCESRVLVYLYYLLWKHF